MLGNFQPHAAEYLRFLPEIILSVFGIVIMVLEAITSSGRSRRSAILGCSALRWRLPPMSLAYGEPRPGFPEHDRGGQLRHILPWSCSGGRLSLHPDFVQLSGARERADGEYYALICSR